MAYCGHVVERSLVLGKEAETRYEKAYRKHVENMERRHRNRYEKAYGDNGSDQNDDSDYDEGEEVMDQYYDDEFWPKPRKILAEYSICHDGDSDDECTVFCE